MEPKTTSYEVPMELQTYEVRVQVKAGTKIDEQALGTLLQTIINGGNASSDLIRMEVTDIVIDTVTKK